MAVLKSPEPRTRLDHIRALLDAAAGDSRADYGGLGRFWNLPLAELLQAELDGVRLVAPAPPKRSSCCGDDGYVPPPRSAASGLVRGLRGDAPFDGTRFPRLPWGGAPLTDEDIQIVAEWIDDGCPAEDPVEVRAEWAEVTVSEAETVVDPDAASYRPQAGEARQRVNLDCMTPAQLDTFRAAFRELYRLNKWPEDTRSYNSQALIHQNHCQHGWERFLPWHRVYLYEFEQALLDVEPNLVLPYWDWTMPQYRPHTPEKGWIIPRAYKAWLTEESLAFLQAATPALPKEAADALRDGMVKPGALFTSPTTFFAEVDRLTGTDKYSQGLHRCRFIDALLAVNSLWYPLRYPAEYGGKTINTAIHYHYPTAEDMRQILALRTFRDFGGGSLYNDSYGFIDQNPHNTMHIWTGGENPHAASDETKADGRKNRNRGVQVAGRRFHSRGDLYTQPAFGDMFSNLTASYDPIFWPIHVNVDRLWAEWQQSHPNSNPVELDAVLTPWSYTVRDTLDITKFGYEYVRSSVVLPVGLGSPVGRYVSRPIAVEPEARGFQQAEVRLHRVPQLIRSCFIRVFLNLPDANAATPLDHPNYAGYLSIFGHGPCIGGPGHCALPPARARAHDLRPRSHNTPRNHRVDVTRTARRLLDEGASDLRITLVVVGADYEEDRELLRLDGVSLNLLD